MCRPFSTIARRCTIADVSRKRSSSFSAIAKCIVVAIFAVRVEVSIVPSAAAIQPPAFSSWSSRPSPSSARREARSPRATTIPSASVGTSLHRLLKAGAGEVPAGAVQVADLVHDLDPARFAPAVDRLALKVGGLELAAPGAVADHAHADVRERGAREAPRSKGALFLSRSLESLESLESLAFLGVGLFVSVYSPNYTFVFTREELLRGVWGYQSIGTTRTLDSHASRLRRKLTGRATAS